MEWKLGCLGLLGRWGSPFPCQDLRVGVLKVADPARMGVAMGQRDLRAEGQGLAHAVI